jgi:hypothetical protein
MLSSPRHDHLRFYLRQCIRWVISNNSWFSMRLPGRNYPTSKQSAQPVPWTSSDSTVAARHAAESYQLHAWLRVSHRIVGAHLVVLTDERGCFKAGGGARRGYPSGSHVRRPSAVTETFPTIDETSTLEPATTRTNRNLLCRPIYYYYLVRGNGF